MQNFKKLKVWEKSHNLALEIYKVTSLFPKSELYGLTNQIRRASVSIPSNIAEGCGRSGGFDFSRFLVIALGSASELEYHLMLSNDLGFLSASNYAKLSKDITYIKRMLTNFIKKIKEKTDN